MLRPAVALLALLFCAACSAPPQKEIDRAQGAIDAARAAGAEQYAPVPFTAATTAMKETHDAVQQRDYRLALSRAIDANERALESAREAANGKARAQGEADAAVNRVATAVRQLEERLKVADAAHLPPRETEAARRARDGAQKALQEARAGLASGSYLQILDVTKGMPERITAEIRTLNEAIDARAGRGVKRRR